MINDFFSFLSLAKGSKGILLSGPLNDITWFIITDIIHTTQPEDGEDTLLLQNVI